MGDMMLVLASVSDSTATVLYILKGPLIIAEKILDCILSD